MAKFTLSRPEFAKELGMTETDIDAVVPTGQDATFADRAAFDALKAELATKPAGPERNAALAAALSQKRFSAETSVQGATSARTKGLAATLDARGRVTELRTAAAATVAATGAATTALAHGDVKGAIGALHHAKLPAETPTQNPAPATTPAGAETPAAAPATPETLSGSAKAEIKSELLGAAEAAKHGDLK